MWFIRVTGKTTITAIYRIAVKHKLDRFTLEAFCLYSSESEVITELSGDGTEAVNQHFVLSLSNQYNKWFTEPETLISVVNIEQQWSELHTVLHQPKSGLLFGKHKWTQCEQRKPVANAGGGREGGGDEMFDVDEQSRWTE